jgi:hypothetical protein
MRCDSEGCGHGVRSGASSGFAVGATDGSWFKGGLMSKREIVAKALLGVAAGSGEPHGVPNSATALSWAASPLPSIAES